MPPRIAAWRPSLGCAQLPIGATMEMVKHLPRLPASLKHPNFDDRGRGRWATRRRPRTARGAEGARLDAVVAKAFDGETYRGQPGAWSSSRTARSSRSATRAGSTCTCPPGPTRCARASRSTVVGVGVKKGLVDIHKKAPLAEWRRPGDPRGEITINDLLHMASGLYTESAGDPQPELYHGRRGGRGALGAQHHGLGAGHAVRVCRAPTRSFRFAPCARRCDDEKRSGRFRSRRFSGRRE